MVMMYPILCKVKFETLHHVFSKKDIWVQIAFSVFMNWVIAPLVMVSYLYNSRQRVDDLL
jgi:ACR3 family arsenite transporter